MQCLRFKHILSHNEKQTLRRNNMKKAILVNDHASVEQGYTVESAEFDLLADTVKQIKEGEKSAKQPHVRIEFDDIRDVPKVWVDGELIEELINLKVLWNTNTQTENYKEFDVYYYDLTGERPMRRGFREGTPR